MDVSKFNKPEFLPVEEGRHRLGYKDLFALSVRIFKVRPARTFLTILGMSFGIGVVLFLVSLGSGLQYILIGKLAATEDSLITAEAYYPPESNLTITHQTLHELNQLPDVAELSPVAEFQGEATINGVSGYLTVRITAPSYARLSGSNVVQGQWYTEADHGVLMSASVPKLFTTDSVDPGTFLNKYVSMKVFYEQQGQLDVSVIELPRTVPIQGIVGDETQPPTFFIPIHDLERSPPPFYQRVYVKAIDIDHVESLRNALLEKGFIVSARVDLVRQARGIMNIITILLGVFGAAALVVSAIGMFNTMIIGFLERIFEVGIMKSIGATSEDIRNLFLMESFIIGGLGGLCGVLIGVGGGELVNAGLNFLARYLGGKPLNLFIYPWEFIIAILVLSTLVGLLAGFWPARRAAVISPRTAFRRGG